MEDLVVVGLPRQQQSTLRQTRQQRKQGNTRADGVILGSLLE